MREDFATDERYRSKDAASENLWPIFPRISELVFLEFQGIHWDIQTFKVLTGLRPNELRDSCGAQPPHNPQLNEAMRSELFAVWSLGWKKLLTPNDRLTKSMRRFVLCRKSHSTNSQSIPTLWSGDLLFPNLSFLLTPRLARIATITDLW